MAWRQGHEVVEKSPMHSGLYTGHTLAFWSQGSSDMGVYDNKGPPKIDPLK